MSHIHKWAQGWNSKSRSTLDEHHFALSSKFPMYTYRLVQRVSLIECWQLSPPRCDHPDYVVVYQTAASTPSPLCLDCNDKQRLACRSWKLLGLFHKLLRECLILIQAAINPLQEMHKHVGSWKNYLKLGAQCSLFSFHSCIPLPFGIISCYLSVEVPHVPFRKHLKTHLFHSTFSPIDTSMSNGLFILWNCFTNISAEHRFFRAWLCRDIAAIEIWLID